MTSVTCISFSNSWDCGKLILVKRVWPCRCSVLAEQQQITPLPTPHLFLEGPDTGGTVKCLWRHCRTEISVQTLTEQQNALSVVVACLYLLFITRFLLFAMRSTKPLEQNIIRSRQPPRLLNRGKQSQKPKHSCCNKQTVHTPLFLCLRCGPVSPSIAVGSSDLRLALGWGTGFH